MMLDKDENGFSDISNRKLMAVLMEEIAAVFKDLKGDINGLGRRVENVEKEIKGVSKDLKNFTYKVDQNQIAFLSTLGKPRRAPTSPGGNSRLSV